MLYINTYYHIYNHANGDDNLFREDKNYNYFLQMYHQHIKPIADTISRCLMKNHFHLLIKIKKLEFLQLLDNLGFKNLDCLNEKEISNLLSKPFSNFFNTYTKAFNKSYNRRDSLFIKNFKRKEIDNNRYLQQIILYIHLNPKKHGFVQYLNFCQHSSYHTFFDHHSELAIQLFENKMNYFDQHNIKPFIYKQYQDLENELT